LAVAGRAGRATVGLRLRDFGLRDFEAVRLREDVAVLRVRDFAAVLARGFGFGLAAALAGVDEADFVGAGVGDLAGVVDFAGVVDLADVVSFDDSAGFVSGCFGAVSVAMFDPWSRGT
jgi:hypothetical protein